MTLEAGDDLSDLGEIRDDGDDRHSGSTLRTGPDNGGSFAPAFFRQRPPFTSFATLEERGFVAPRNLPPLKEVPLTSVVDKDLASFAGHYSAADGREHLFYFGLELERR